MIVKSKRFPKYLFSGVPSAETTFLKFTFEDDGSLVIVDEWGEALGYYLKLPNLLSHFKVELLDGEGKVTIRYVKGGEFLELTFHFEVEYKVGVQISGRLKNGKLKGKLKLPFEMRRCFFNEKAKLFWTGHILDGELLSGIGFDFSDVPDAVFNVETRVLTVKVEEEFSFDPSVVATSTASTATSCPPQRKSFYAQGLHWVFFSNGYYIHFATSSDGVSWTDNDTGWSGSTGRQFAVFFDGTYVHMVYNAYEQYNYPVNYRRGTPNADGTITWGSEQYAIQWAFDEYGRVYSFMSFYKSLISGDIYDLSHTNTGVSVDYTTEVNIGSYGAGNKFVFTPYTTVTSPVGTSLPTAIQNKGWEYCRSSPPPNKIWMLEGYARARIRVRNPDAIAHEGNLYARLWIATSSDLSDAEVLTDWSYASVSFDGTAGQIIDVDINLNFRSGAFEDAMKVKGKYLYIELLWDVTTAAANARVQVEGHYGSSGIDIVGSTGRGDVYYWPVISVDSNGYPWIGFRRFNGYYYFVYVAKGNANDGTWNFRESKFWFLKYLLDIRANVAVPVELTNGKMYVVYTMSLEVYGRLWDGTAFGSEEDIAGVQHPWGINVVSNGDNVDLVRLEGTTYDIEHEHRDYASGTWSHVATVQAGTTSTSYPVLAVDQNTGNLYCFWAGSPTSDHIYYKKYDASAGSWDASPTDWIDESAEVLTGNDRLTCFIQAYDGKIGLVYMTKTASPYNVKYAFLTVVVPVVAKRIIGDGLTWIVT